MEVLIVEQMDYISTVDGAVSKEEAARIEEIKADLAKLKAPSFSASSPPVFGVPEEYAKEGQHVAAEVVDEIAGWVTRAPPR